MVLVYGIYGNDKKAMSAHEMRRQLDMKRYEPARAVVFRRV